MLHPELKNKKDIFDYFKKYSESSGEQDSLHFWRHDGLCFCKDIESNELYSENNGKLQVLLETQDRLIFCLNKWNKDRDYFFFIHNPKRNMSKITEISDCKC